MEMKIIEEDLRHFEFLAINSKEIIEKQVDSYRQQHSYAGTIIGFTVLLCDFLKNGSILLKLFTFFASSLGNVPWETLFEPS